MTAAEIKRTQERVGTLPDGFWGQKSIAACQEHLRRLMPAEARWPTEREVRSGNSIFGQQGVKDGYTPPMQKIKLPFPLYLYGPDGQEVRTISSHIECADSLLAVFEELAVTYPDRESRAAAGILWYFGIYNPRPVRGGSSASMHSWGIAIDLDANNNANKTHWPTRAKMPIEVFEAFARQGWTSAGAWWHRDAMHSSSTSP